MATLIGVLVLLGLVVALLVATRSPGRPRERAPGHEAWWLWAGSQGDRRDGGGGGWFGGGDFGGGGGDGGGGG